MGHLNLRPERLRAYLRDELECNPNWQFARDIGRLVWQYKWHSAAIILVTIFQEFASLWPVTLLGEFIDRLETGSLGNVVWLFLAASLFYPALARANIVLRHRVFYETDFRKMVELVLKVSDRGGHTDSESAGAAYTRAANAVSGVTNATFYLLGNITPVIIKIMIVSGSLLGYNRLLGLVYVASLIVPTLMTIVFNRWLRVLLDSQYSVASDLSGAAIKTISERENQEVRSRFLDIMRTRKRVFMHLLVKGQFYTYAREAALIGSQFTVVFIALAMRAKLGLTPGDFAKIVGYTGQVAATFITAAAVVDAMVSYSRAYHIYVTTQD